MKKFTSFILVVVMLLSITIMPTFAETTETKYLYKDKFIEYKLQSYQELLCYEELFYHKDTDGNIDWVFIMAYTNTFEEMSIDTIVADVYIHLDSRCTPFSLGYCVYDVNKDKFLSIGYYEDYEGMEEYINKNIGVPIGDADMDGALTVLDATFIQRAVAQLCEFDDNDYILSGDVVSGYLSDYDRDGERTVMDATAIQLKLGNYIEYFDGGHYAYLEN